MVWLASRMPYQDVVEVFERIGHGAIPATST